MKSYQALNSLVSPAVTKGVKKPVSIWQQKNINILTICSAQFFISYPTSELKS